MLDAETVRRIHADAAARYPAECCGFVRGRRVVPCRNVIAELAAARGKVRDAGSGFAFGPADLRALDDSFDSADPAHTIYHSHVGAGAFLSAEDLRYALVDGRPAHPVEHLVVDVLGGAVAGSRVFAFDPARGSYAPVRDHDADGNPVALGLLPGRRGRFA
ncbi:hypothetical protein GCM10010123_10900 [Pilimelia anulata]|uniref:JAB domain-containing protein n=1 Tax=Pilimelia anulata TaxID=53371 RepID=A0A8J3B469_9ACTN|nr:Mov34/MPN/PAD-1 family protein [Pilimelia anulata]GGJ83109.1 hypothetical protein GCM10010123_10900 [Pilimelia anulata]